MTRLRWIILVLAVLALGSRFLAFDRGGAAAHGEAGTALWVFDHGYHAGLVLPRATLARSGGALSKAWLAQFPEAEWFEFGWGDAGFYYEVPSFADVTAAVAAKALLVPSRSVLHVATGRGRPEAVFAGSDAVRLVVTDAAVMKILAFVETGTEDAQPLGAGLYLDSAFYAGRGRYHMFQTCNSWVSQALRAGGLASAPGPAVLSKSLLWDLRLRYEN